VPDVPASPPIVMFPLLAFRVRFRAPVTVWLKVILPVPLPVLRLRSAAIATGLANEILAPLVITDPPIVTFPAPVWAKAPLKLIVPEAVLVKSPALAIVSPPELSVVMAAPRVMAFVVIEMPAAPVVLKTPLNRVVPVPALWMMDPAEIACAVTLPAFTMVNEVRGVLDPRFCWNWIFPVPAFRVIGNAPSIVP